MASTKYFCTLFDSHYLFKGVVMLRSLLQHCADARIYVLCMDARCKTLLERMALPGVECLALDTVENPQLLIAKQNRNVAEYCWTLSASLTAWLLEHRAEVDMLTYVDADLMFFSSLDSLFEEIGDASISITEHRFTPRLRHLEENGRFCVQWVSFRRDAQGLRCLHHWRDQCIEWCYARLEDGRMGDQKYLDAWPSTYSSVHIVQHLGVGLAPWNYPNYRIERSGEGAITVDGRALIFYHFHQFQLLDDGTFDRLSTSYTVEQPAPEIIYQVYEQQMHAVVAQVRVLSADFSAGMKSKAYVKSRRWVHKFLPQGLKDLLKRVVKY